MKKSRVAIINCETYSEDKVYQAVKKGIDLLGGVDKYIQDGEKILLKPNVLVGDKPERNTTTHPAVFKAVAKVLGESKADLYYGDSPGFGSPEFQLKRSGFTLVANELNIKIADFHKGKEIEFQDSPFVKKFNIANGVLESDGLINISKMKTHGLTRITGAVKNLFGCVPGLLKAEYHVKMPNVFDFAKMLVSLNLLLKPRLHIMDGIVAMQGNGPRSGEAINMNVILVAEDPIALDAVFCKLIKLNPDFVPTSKPGKEWGLGTYIDEEIELVGDDIKDLITGDFDVVRKPVKSVTSSNIVSFLKNLVSPRPVIDKDRCTKCGVCIEVCLVDGKAVNWWDGDKTRPPQHNYRKCIRCYCCQELCPYKAISIKTPILGKLLLGN
jgi:uncharacterized protein (DUF362 family)/NAD-dependent dihydropyrimidine dehydrogenase PreA subunit